jgi:hypothetical protein
VIRYFRPNDFDCSNDDDDEDDDDGYDDDDNDDTENKPYWALRPYFVKN